MRNPKVFLFDEPLSNLDAKLRVQMRIELIELHDRLNATMIYVTHDQVEAMTMGTKIVVMRDGKVQQIGAPLYLYNQPINKFVAGFLGTPPMNFMTVKVIEEGGQVRIDEGSFKLTPTPAHQALLKNYVGKEISFGIRPEDLPPQRDQGRRHDHRQGFRRRAPRRRHQRLLGHGQALDHRAPASAPRLQGRPGGQLRARP